LKNLVKQLETLKAVWNLPIEQCGCCEAQLGLIIPNVCCADAKCLRLKKDTLHFTTEARCSGAKYWQMSVETTGFLKKVTWW